MFRKFYTDCLVASVCCLLFACGSEERALNISSSAYSPLEKPATSSIPIPVSIEKPKEIEKLLPTFSTYEEKVEKVNTEEIIQHESDLGTQQQESDLEIIDLEIIDLEVIEKEFEDTDVFEVDFLRRPEKNSPLDIVSIGDSVSFDAEPGLRASLESTGVIRVETRSFGGIGISLEGFDRYLEEALINKPEVVTVMLGGFDLKFLSKNENTYEHMLAEAVDRILQDAKHIIWVGMPPTPVEENLEENRLLFNSIIKTFSESNPQVHYLDTDLILGGPQGDFQRFLNNVEGEISQIRKVRDGRDDGHLCPAGAALIGEIVYEKLLNLVFLPERAIDWWSGEWTRDRRYDDPLGGCSHDFVK